MSETTPFLSVEDQDSVRWVTLTSPGRANAIPATGWSELLQELEAFESSAARALVLTGAGGDFCAGADLNVVGGLRDLGDVTRNHGTMVETSRTALTLHRLSKPTVAAVDGLAVGAGMNLAIGCDIVLASTRARFAEIFAKRGLAMDMGGTWLLPRIVGLARAREIALTGRIVHASEALDIGLVSRVVEPEDLESAATALASDLAAGAPLALRALKVGLDRSSSFSFEQALAAENQAQAMLMASQDASEGIMSFVEQRPPRFEGR
jgi:2-(1,2-epoxy-1,2-dihydrophenyl)acetyl-CoA isomerase